MRVIEADLIPEMHLEPGNIYVTVGTEPTEPLAGRIVETPEDAHQANFLRNPRATRLYFIEPSYDMSNFPLTEAR